MWSTTSSAVRSSVRALPDVCRVLSITLSFLDAAVAFLMGPIIVLVVGITMLGTHHVAGLAMTGAGGVLTLVGLALSGHSSIYLV